MHQISATYHYWLLALSFGVATPRSYTTVDWAAGATTNGGWASVRLTGVHAVGSGNWHMRLIGMPALHLPLSLLAAITASFTALYATGRERMAWLRPGIGSRVLGNGIASMRSIQMAAIHGYDRALCVVKFPLCAAKSWEISRQEKETQRAREQTYQSMFDEALVGMFKVGPDGHLLDGNPVMANVLGYTDAEELRSMITEPLWSRAVSRERRDQLMALVKAAGHARSFELEVFRKDGSTVWISANVRAQSVDGEPSGFMGSFEDITERRLLRDQSLQSQKLESVGQLAAGIAHEINTPVQYIGDNVRFLADSFAELMTLNVGYGRLLAAAQKGKTSPEMVQVMTKMVAEIDVAYLLAEIPKALEQTVEGISRVSALVGAMKEFSHPGTGEKVLVNLNLAIENTIAVARNEWKYVADMKLELDCTLPLVTCLPGEFNQVVLNLIINAAHAIEDVAASGSGERGQITIQTRRLAGWVEVKISDTGGGIPEAVRPRIFDPFFTTREIGKGTGQGLAIARSVVVDKHQGTIEFETEEGHGTSFIVRLPCEGDQSPSPDLEAA